MMHGQKNIKLCAFVGQNFGKYRIVVWNALG